MKHIRSTLPSTCCSLYMDRCAAPAAPEAPVHELQVFGEVLGPVDFPGAQRSSAERGERHWHLCTEQWVALITVDQTETNFGRRHSSCAVVFYFDHILRMLYNNMTVITCLHRFLVRFLCLGVFHWEEDLLSAQWHHTAISQWDNRKVFERLQDGVRLAVTILQSSEVTN